ncbi:MAG TPA: TonB-dependent receptor plug domain-containing protein, partial [Steroidobacteraceae bacterium]
MKTIDTRPKASRTLLTIGMPLLAATLVVTLAVPVPAAAAATAAADAANSDAADNSGVEQVIVTANRRAENLQAVPTSVSAVTAEQLKDLGVTSTTAIAQYVPGVQLMTVNANTDNFFSIRGATQNDYAEHEESPVAVYMDGVYLSQAAGTGALLFDTERVEVLRGPQGTLFGRNATAGLVQYISKAPTDHPDGYFETSYGNYNSNHTELAFSDGIVPGLSFRISAASDYMDPYLKNALYPDKGANNSNSRAIRMQLLWEPTDGFDANLNLHGVILNDRGGLYKFTNVYGDPNNHYLSTYVPPNVNVWPDSPYSCPGCDILGYKQPSGYDYYTSAADIVGYNKEH